MRIGILGGSFDPPHQGHIHISTEAIKKLRLNQLWWIPTLKNPLKNPTKNDYKQRFISCRNIVEFHPKIYAKKIDYIYASELIKKLQSRYKNHKFYWITGADNIAQLHRWKNFHNFIFSTTLAIFSREDFLKKIIKTKIFHFYKKLRKSKNHPPKFLLFRSKNFDLSSTKIRNSEND